jgi:hypothetical protein
MRISCLHVLDFMAYCLRLEELALDTICGAPPVRSCRQIILGELRKLELGAAYGNCCMNEDNFIALHLEASIIQDLCSEVTVATGFTNLRRAILSPAPGSS